MSDHPQPTSDAEHGRPPVPANAPDIVSDPDGQDTPPQPALGDTVGTGTSIALGCIAGTLLLVVIGLVFLLVVWLIG